MRKYILLIVALALVAWLARTSLFTVDRTEYVYLTQFGRPVATFDGAQTDEAGLHFKLPSPIQSVQRLDRRLQYFDLPGTELLTSDTEGKSIDKTLTVDAYVCWRIADKEGVDRFIRTLGTPDKARTVLSGFIGGRLGAAVAQMKMDDLISTKEIKVEENGETSFKKKVDVKRKELRDRLLGGTAAAGDGLQERALADYGIELVDVRLRRSNHPPAVREAIFDRIRSERAGKVAEYQSDGFKQSEDIKSAAERKVRETLADARAEEQRVKGEADAEADRVRNQAYAKDAQFYAFLKKLEEYQRILGDNKTMLLLSAHRELFDLLFAPPKPGTAPKPIAEESSRPSDKKGDGQ
jgi:membrane protease subunit HflC